MHDTRLVLYDDKHTRLEWDGRANVCGFRYQGVRLVSVSVFNAEPINNYNVFNRAKNALNSRYSKVGFDGFVIRIGLRALGGADDGEVDSIKGASIEDVRSAQKEEGAKEICFDPLKLPKGDRECIEIMDKLRNLCKLDEIYPAYNKSSLMQVKFSAFVDHSSELVRYASLESLITLLERPQKSNQRSWDVILTECQLAHVLDSLSITHISKINVVLLMRAYRMTLEKLICEAATYKQAFHPSLTGKFYKGGNGVLSHIKRKWHHDPTFRFEYEVWFIEQAASYIKEHDNGSSKLLSEANHAFLELLAISKEAAAELDESGITNQLTALVMGAASSSLAGFILKGLFVFVSANYE